MGNKNYTKFSQHFNKNKEQNNVEVMDGQVTIDEVVNGETVAEIVQEVESVIETAVGVVTGCKKLYVRTEPDKNSKPLCMLDWNTEVTVNLTGSTDDFYKVTTSSGIKGYCMKKYISIIK